MFLHEIIAIERINNIGSCTKQGRLEIWKKVESGTENTCIVRDNTDKDSTVLLYSLYHQ